MVRPLIVGNWKAYVTSLKEAKDLFKAIDKNLPRGLKADIVVAPPAPFLYALSEAYRGKRIAFAAQDASYEEGKHTGAVAPPMLADAGASYVIVGHSDRRAAGDTDELISKKVVAILAAGLTPILCVGEKERDREGHYLSEIESSLTASLARIEPAMLKKVVIAYEPVWAIGSSAPIAPSAVREALIFIRKTLASRFDRAMALKVQILYGAAVDKDTAAAIMTDGDAGGLLLGRASVDAAEFIGVIKAAC